MLSFQGVIASFVFGTSKVNKISDLTSRSAIITTLIGSIGKSLLTT